MSDCHNQHFGVADADYYGGVDGCEMRFGGSDLLVYWCYLMSPSAGYSNNQSFR